MTVPVYQRRLHWFAIVTSIVMLATLCAGALVTSRNAGMAFRDWPTSDGQPMLTYPWLQDFATDKDKFLEHGHRLAGVMIGCTVIALLTAVCSWETRGWVKGLAAGLLAGVIIQGLLGGFRVWLDQRGLAMLHGFFAACVASLLATLITVESRGWYAAAERPAPSGISRLKPLAAVIVGLLTLQYLLGGMIRHHHTGLHEHLGLGILSLAAVLVNAIVVQKAGVNWVRWSGWGLLAAVLAQVGLGAAAWITRWGFSQTGYVATADSIEQVGFRSAHMVFGIVVYATAVVHLVRVLRVSSTCSESVDEEWLTRSFASAGGAR